LSEACASTTAFAAGVDPVKPLALSVPDVWQRSIATAQEMYAL
jgi:hypothetical protein